ncbi:IQ calmodulin-binding motif-containing protein 1-like [Larimichthys crocea]|uniref:IQ calmodulin-binding motif-containing protein 1-like n=1 Tax=Larimichthys crocea TaxID=215358 RepID=UPI000F5EE187|nr:IQ calmodulin-binding motif-containing protein 1-like [Larimichthys crocea]
MSSSMSAVTQTQVDEWRNHLDSFRQKRSKNKVKQDSALFQVRCFLQKRRAAKAPPITPFWIGQIGLTDSRRVELKRQVEEYIALHPSTRVSLQECERLHEEVQLLLSELQRGDHQRREEERMEALLAHTHTQLELLRDAPPLSVVTATDAESFLSPSGPIASRARDAHNAVLQASRLPWWRTLGETACVGEFSPTHLQELEAELGGLFVGGVSRMNL